MTENLYKRTIIKINYEHNVFSLSKCFTRGNVFDIAKPGAHSPYLPYWGLESTCSRVDLQLERISRDLLFNNNQVANQRRAMTMNTLRYLPTREARTTERSSTRTLLEEQLTQGIHGERGSHSWAPDTEYSTPHN